MNMLKTKNKISKAIQYIIVCMIMAGCTDNSISFDFNRNAVYTQEGNGIYNLFVEEEGLNLMAYSVEWREGSEAANVFYFNRHNPSYKVVKRNTPEIPMIKLKPLTTYTIENHSNGDINPGVVFFKTDSLGRPLVNTYKELNRVDEYSLHWKEMNDN